MGCRATLALKQKFLAGTLYNAEKHYYNTKRENWCSKWVLLIGNFRGFFPQTEKLEPA